MPMRAAWSHGSVFYPENSAVWISFSASVGTDNGVFGLGIWEEGERDQPTSLSGSSPLSGDRPTGNSQLGSGS